ncbi:hypothetical protein D7B24_008163 [Verticillium nonalfalfae]|uniref:Uncharacterized protein n=1 Tax=Verticillium nonalfalfae TaxID=1051616 RepID=A0A3M9YKD8_9PEZI|nr:uncharacterized protein D7B24_008163 [Verticillium nonalfalfae]RNJ60471.1 hypothetical protein D7B24_008163 [Verticillium nonalfalfae]
MPSPIVTATLQASTLSTVSNLCAQFIQAYQEQRPFRLDLIQLLRFIILSAVTCPPNFHWQQFLERSFPAYPLPAHAPTDRSAEIELKRLDSEPSRLEDGTVVAPEPQFSLRNTLTKWFVDCITMGAIMNTVAFLVIMGALKGQGLGPIWYNVETQTIPIIVAGYKIWPLASIISFSFVPVHRRVVFLSFIGLIWGVYMSLVAAKV